MNWFVYNGVRYAQVGRDEYRSADGQVMVYPPVPAPFLPNIDLGPQLPSLPEVFPNVGTPDLQPSLTWSTDDPEPRFG